MIKISNYLNLVGKEFTSQAEKYRITIYIQLRIDEKNHTGAKVIENKCAMSE
jgi:hypothetical protein